MKLCFVFMVCFVCIGYGRSLAQEQKVTLNLDHATLFDLFNQINSQTGLRFLYNSEHLEKVKQVSVHVEQKKVCDVLDRVFKETILAYEYDGEVVVIVQKNDDKKKQLSLFVKGWVYDVKKQPMPGVTIKVVGTTVGTATNSKGWFLLQLPMQQGTLEFSFVGYKKQQINFTEKTDTLRVVMEENISKLDEVVVVAYGEQNKREVVGAMSTVKGDDFKDIPSPSLSNLLQ